VQESDRVEFKRLLEALFGALNKPVTEGCENGFWKGLEKMSLPMFGRCVEFLLQELEQKETPRGFSVSDVWAARRKLKAPAQTYLHQQPESPEGWKGDRWDIQANMRLLEYLTKRLSRDPRCYGEVSRAIPWAADAVATAEQRACTRILVGYKGAWARDMREEPNATAEFRDDCWRDCMMRAEAEIKTFLETSSAAPRQAELA